MTVDKDGEPFGPSVMALDPPHSMLWSDTEGPHRFTWLWWLRDDGGRGTRDPITALVIEVADTSLMRRCMLNIARRAEADAAPAPHELVEART